MRYIHPWHWVIASLVAFALVAPLQLGNFVQLRFFEGHFWICLWIPWLLGGLGIVRLKMESDLLKLGINPDAARRFAVLTTIHLALAYLGSSWAIVVCYYLTDLRWYHAYQYAAYISVPGLVTLIVLRQYMTAGEAELPRLLDRGRTLAALQAALMATGIAVMAAMGKIRNFTHADWAAMNILLAGAIAVAALSIIAIIGDDRLRPKILSPSGG